MSPFVFGFLCGVWATVAIAYASMCIADKVRADKRRRGAL